MSILNQTVVVGAGIGGLSAAIRLALAGQSVIVLEKNDAVGGKMSQIETMGYRWDTGPSVITMRHVLEDLFNAAGRKMSDYLTLVPVDPLTRYFYQDGTVLDVTRDLPRMLEQIEELNRHDVEGYLNFLAYAAKLYRITGPTFVYDRPPDWATLTKVPPWQFLQVDPWLTLDQAIRQRIRSPHLRQMLGRFATYVGASPFLAPATLAVIAHVELSGGVWYPRGGIYSIAQALHRLALELGVLVETGCSAQQIGITNARVQGVMTIEGRFFAADSVMANVDVTTIYHHLLPQEVATQKRRHQLAARDTSCSGYALLLGIEAQFPQLAHHNIFFSEDYKREFSDIFDAAYRLAIQPSMLPSLRKLMPVTHRLAVKTGSYSSMHRRQDLISIGTRMNRPIVHGC